MSKTKLSNREAEETEQWAELVLPWLSPPTLAAAAATSRSLRCVAAAVTSRRAADAARGLELHPIPFLNPTPDSCPYAYFLYCRFPFLLRPPSSQPWGGGPGMPVFDPSSLAPVTSASAGLGNASGCRCADCSVEAGCPCSGSLDVQRTGMSLVSECGEECSCGLGCLNRTTQRGIRVRLKIVRDVKKGWGLHADQILRKGEFICEYAGSAWNLFGAGMVPQWTVSTENWRKGLTSLHFQDEESILSGLFLTRIGTGRTNLVPVSNLFHLLNLSTCERTAYSGEFVKIKEARRRLRAYDELASAGDFSHALLVVREHLPSGKTCMRINIDATNIGNVARFINHSCDGGNLLVVLVRNSGSILPRLCFFAAKDISEAEELTFSYGNTCARPNSLPCFCGKDACGGFLPSEDT
ncbi:Histone-lysine N-methyltransferase SUVR3 [Apostasia shenzhenica]|uniref:Histone-lysine N-methyltransferase SUVR3 n=1 Tax=Apostasia shenzhenica TaxID=1088818 RepID=A0A2H9ZRB6_9ASPA|nr:Histone-lysine N-methyltransferase SUVR3 [Apostasia shenzhenica]